MDFDVIVVGGGHAGVEASLVAAKMGQRVALITSRTDRIAYMSCNPSIGGLAKGHMVREIDVLGGIMGLAADATCIQFKRLNSRKGPAVRGSRAQCDKQKYSEFVTKLVFQQTDLSVIEGEAKELVIEEDRCSGIVLKDGSVIQSRAVVVTTGTFMRGVMHVGKEQASGGRVGECATVGLSDQLRALGFNVGRLKTGTPARLLRDSIDWSKLEAQYGDERFYPFSFRSPRHLSLEQVPCFVGYTNERTHEIIRNNIHLSPMYCGAIEGVGPRYCPSIEDKVYRFADKSRHQTFLEPEGLSTDWIYLQGMSTSLPEDVQDAFIRSIEGLSSVKVAQWGYAVEYDFVEPTQLWRSLETKEIGGLFLAGQINGTSGYEEAGAQGIIAGINACRYVQGNSPLILGRDEAYIGVMIDDLVTKGTREPYRMFTSRAENRLVLREDNTSTRLAHRSEEVGALRGEERVVLNRINSNRNQFKEKLNNTMLYPNEATNLVLEKFGTARIINPTSLAVLCRRPEVEIETAARIGGLLDEANEDWALVCEGVEAELKYEGYIVKQEELIAAAKKMEEFRIPRDLDFGRVVGLSREESEKLSKFKPETLGQAGRISGVNPSAIQALLIFLRGSEKRPKSIVAPLN